MNFSQRQADPRRHLVGIGFVILLHLAIVYALVTGLAKKVVDVVRAPIETKVIEETRKPPPPPEVVIPPPPRLEAPPPPFIPPPEVQIAAPPPPQPTITVSTPTPPPAPVVIAPVPPPVVAAPAPPARPAPTGAAAYCAKMPQPEIPGVDYTGKIALNMRATIRGNRLEQIELVPGSFSGSSDRKIQRAFVNAAVAAMQEYVCAGDGIPIVQPFGFTITN